MTVGGGGSTEETRGGVLSALRHRDYLLFWCGALISNTGTWIQNAALLWYVKTSTGSDAWVGAVNMANFVPVLLFILFAGYLADTTDRKRLVLAAFTVMLLSALALGICASGGVLSLAAIMVAVFVSGTAYTLALPAGLTILPELVSKEEMLNALALSSAQFNIGRVVGPAIGAAIIASMSVGTAFYVNAVSFAFFVAAIALLKTKLERKTLGAEGAFHHIAEGFRYVVKRRWMVGTLAALGLASFFGFSCVVIYPAVARDVLALDAHAYGVLLSLTGVGAAAGAPLVTWLNRRFPERAIIKGCIVLLGMVLVGISLSRAFWLTSLLSIGIGSSFLILRDGEFPVGPEEDRLVLAVDEVLGAVILRVFEPCLLEIAALIPVEPDIAQQVPGGHVGE